jgi:hypothetical protein
VNVPLKAAGMANASTAAPSADTGNAVRPSSCMESSRGCLYMLYALKSIASALSVFMRLFSSNAVSINDSNTVQVMREKMMNMRDGEEKKVMNVSDGKGIEKGEDSKENAHKIVEAL